jgi:hypothetical protein
MIKAANLSDKDGDLGRVYYKCPDCNWELMLSQDQQKMICGCERFNWSITYLAKVARQLQEELAKLRAKHKQADDTPSVDADTTCSTCKQKKADARPRSDNGLEAGTHCDACWNKMISDCRSRSW